MQSTPLRIGDLAFVGPLHAPALPRFGYVRVSRLDGDTVYVSKVEPEDEEEEFAVVLATIMARKVGTSEITLLPGSYFARDGPILSVLEGSTTISVRLLDPPQIIKVDPINYALQVGATVSDMFLNDRELLQQQVCVTLQKRRSVTPATIKQLATTPFELDSLVPLVRLHDLQVVQVRRQHILDCTSGPRKKNTLDFYRDPSVTEGQAPTASSAETLTPSDTAEEDGFNFDVDSDDDAIASVQHQHRILGKRTRHSPVEGSLFDSQTADTEQPLPKGSFRPSSIQRQVHRTVVQPQFSGKHPQSLLESMQQSIHVQFLVPPPILRGLYVFSFGCRGLSVMHCKPAQLMDRVEALESASVSTDFSEKNQLRPAPLATSKDDVLNSLRAPRVLAMAFYNDEVIDLIDAATNFLFRYKGLPETEALGWKLMSYWVTSKFNQFRSHLLSGSADAALGVRSEFSRNDEELLELLDLRGNPQAGPVQTHRVRLLSDNPKRAERPRKQTSSIAQEVLAALPRQAGKRICMKFLSNMGCTGNTEGGCFDSKRAHFRPTQLPEVVKNCIVEKFNGLSPANQDLSLFPQLEAMCDVVNSSRSLVSCHPFKIVMNATWIQTKSDFSLH
ncbi:hypothetical protein F441_03842 [Phytophthora nicotianae CJ01A1]|uniref:Uncharacterized protein n=1 Tax=Phytophthora nicotianae CJ01A1 TaxID=1317063 RepID=W2XLZ4_PHYNI|nr:hypothetical protein F441_03842 [Phytophthora nicotianae CJ01A1]